MTAPEWKTTACILCECNCGLEVQLGGEQNRHLVKLRGDDAHPASQGYACEKAHRLDHYQHGPDRITTPLRRKSDGTFEAIDWPTAIREVSARLARVRDTHGGDTIFYYGGGGQGNHLPGAYATATRRALGSRYRSSALAQEKTGEFWVGDRMMGTVTRADFEHCEVALFLGKNPWHSHSIPRARVTLKAIARDPNRTLIVVDPRRTETAELADLHLQVKPGTDAWLLAALVRVLLEEGLVATGFVAAHTEGLDEVRAAFEQVKVAECCAACGVGEALVREAARVMAKAKSMASFEDLGVQMNLHSTLVSYLHHLLVALTGNVGRPGSHYVPTPLVSLFGGASSRKSPVAGARIIAGMTPCNAIADEILTEHPKRYRAMIIEAANPAHSLAESPRFREALRALDTVVVIDVAMTESAREAHYVLPASTQFEKAEATFFNFDFPENVFQLRPRLLEPLPGPLPEAEIHARLCEALGEVTEADYAPLRAAATEGLVAYASKLLELTMTEPRLSAQAPVLLYRTLPLPEAQKEGAVLLGLAAKAAMEHPEALKRAGFGGEPIEAATALFTAMLEKPSGLVFAIDTWEDLRARLPTIQLALPDLLEELGQALRAGPQRPDAAFPFVLSAGERRSFTANTIMRDAAWRKTDGAGALRISPDDAQRLGVATGDRVRVTTRAGSREVLAEVSETMQRGHVSLPNGLGTRLADGSAPGVAPNELTRAADCDPWVGTPWHKHVAANVERVG
ncbi:MAG: molybdopterin-dependent oxidoreductase [Archangiaceae bacterium]|nr:molybdopterin-dependent oxidoreductase [Archangiaceae bacterium]